MGWNSPCRWPTSSIMVLLLRKPFVDYPIELIPRQSAARVGNSVWPGHMVSANVLQINALPKAIDTCSAIPTLGIRIVANLMAADADNRRRGCPELLPTLIARIPGHCDLVIRKISITRRNEAHPSSPITEVPIEDQHPCVIVTQLAVRPPLE